MQKCIEFTYQDPLHNINSSKTINCDLFLYTNTKPYPFNNKRGGRDQIADT